MIRAALWEEMQRLFTVERHSKSAIARDLGLDVKTVRRCLRQPAWRPYQRAAESDTLLTPHHAFLETRAPAVDYSAQILYQELTQQYGYTGSYDTVKRFVRPRREGQRLAGSRRRRGCRARSTGGRPSSPSGRAGPCDTSSS